MSSRQRNAEKRREREAQAILDAEEQDRLNSRSMWEKIDEADSIYDIKEILWEITEQ